MTPKQRKHDLSKKCWCKPTVLRPALNWGDALLRINELVAEAERLKSALRTAREALDGLLDVLDANYDPERCGLSQKDWDLVVKSGDEALDEIDKVLAKDANGVSE